ncbi:16S rRNA (uracil(1498)-N(3))-methyltransferase [Acidomonas methanolica]|uniref:16S rRNA (uracil(1498)-N(3))-methyltransferase n=1 Tax=Acidomonas methanolica TaxID=437 RepID=UPI002119C3B7|nr:16S rRNA (uracil(1498)-N(3))-methyltransferase [Acidomonas methanolica]MCQ9154842.1 16S rRNA (uracil(1498)-N(3))-methyltransferase [Acidomonas methanolica]
MQDAPRLYIDPGQAPLFRPDAELALSPDHARYLGTVLRLGPGDAVSVFNARDGEWDAILTGVRKDRGTLRLAERRRAPDIRVGATLFFAPLKRDATDLVIRMGTELGVSRFAPVMTARTNTHRLNAERLRAIAIEAAEQCERLDVPRIDDPVSLVQAVEAWPAELPLFAAMERFDGAAPLPRESPAEYGVLIGPEGGFAPEERRWIEGRSGVTPLSLGALVLRADTAACAALAVLGAQGVLFDSHRLLK